MTAPPPVPKPTSVTRHGPRPRFPRPSTRHSRPFLDAGAGPLVRPYLTAYEQQERRTALELALDGIDIGPRIIHGVAIGGGIA